MQPETIMRYAAPVPRYTSYPTANHFSDAVTVGDYASWLAAIEPGSRLSLYLHIPYCRAMCWYCACNTQATRQYGPIASYVDTLEAEIRSVAARLPHHTISGVHWGGGSPDILKAEDIRRLGTLLQECFSFGGRAADYAVEIDPRLLEPGQVTAFIEAGVNRVSLGVQDFDLSVQSAIGRQQSFEQTRQAIAAFRDKGVRSVNIDLVYGLPHQTTESGLRTMAQVVDLAPDRIALFGYAHLPSRMKHQRLIKDEDLPGIRERFELSRRLSEALLAAGYEQVGMDHFAKPSDPLARQPLNRNFQGYTTDEAGALIGMGASAIGRLPQGYVQNATSIHEYARRIGEHGLATARGAKLDTDDRVRAHVIERLMCDFTFSEAETSARFGSAAGDAIGIARQIAGSDRDGLIERTADGFRMAADARPFVRSICARFDAYLGASQAKHSLAV